jgi:rubrerythrin
MPTDASNASELATFARKVGAEVLEGNLRDPSKTGSWRLDRVDLGQYLDCYRDQRLMVVFVPLGEAEKETFTCDVCGFVMDELEECPRCKFIAEYLIDIDKRIEEREHLFEDVEGD